MTELALTVDADDELWTLDDLPVSPYVEVGTELIEVRALFPSGIYSLTGQELPPRMRVRRGVGGTTAAGHNSGSALTPIYGLGGGGGGGAIAVTDGTTTVDPASSLLLPSGTVTDEGGGVAGLNAGLPQQPTVEWTLDGDGSGTLEVVGRLIDLDTLAGAANAARSRATATTTGSGAADVRSLAASDDGDATAGSTAAVAGDGAADVVVTATTEGAGGATAVFGATANGAGIAQVNLDAVSTSDEAVLTMQSANDADAISLVLAVTAAGVQSAVFTGLPTADPSVAGALWSDAGALKVSAG